MKRIVIWRIALLLVLGAAQIWAQAPDPPDAVPRPEQGQANDRPGQGQQNNPPQQRNDPQTVAVPIPPPPYFQYIRSASSPDGLVWTRDDGIRLEHASAPCAIVRDDGSILLYFVDSSRLLDGRAGTINCAVASDGTNFQVTGCTIEGRPPVGCHAPSVVRLPDGRFRLYYLASEQDQQRTDAYEIHSAVSPDGFHFEEEGICFAPSGPVAPDVSRRGETWLVYVHRHDLPGTIVATSTNGRDFGAAAADLLLPGWNATSPIPLGNGRYRLYGVAQEPPDASAVHSFASPDGLNWTMEEGVRLPASAGVRPVDPFAVRVGDRYRMYYQEEQRPPEDGSPPEDLYDDTRLSTLSLQFAQPDFWDQLIAHVVDEQDISATLVAEGTPYEHVGVRFKGNSSLRANSAKKPFNISLDAYVDDQQLWGYRTVNLNNGFMDPTLVREKVAYDIFQDYMPAGRASFARLFVNDAYWGVYGNVQQPNSDFVEEWFGDSDGCRFKCEGDLTWQGADVADYQQRYELKSGDDEAAWTGLIHMLDILNNAPADVFEQEIQQVLNVDRALWYIALCNLFANLDSYLGSGHNFYMYGETNGYFHIVPWDLNEAFGAFSQNLTIAEIEGLSPFYQQENAQRPLVRRLLSVPSFRARYLAHYRVLLAEVFSEEYLAPEIRRHQDLIGAAVEADMHRLYPMEAFSRNVEENVTIGRSIPGLLSFVRNRRAYLNTVPELNRPVPIIASVTCEPTHPTVRDTVWVQAGVEDASSIHSLSLHLERGNRFIPIPMADDGMHHDAVERDGLFGAAIAPHPQQAVRYYILAEDDEGTVAFAPTRASHETFTYAVQWPEDLSRRVVAINELMASNVQTAADPQGDFDDWIELLNVSDSEADLAGMYLTDREDDLRKWAFPEGTTLAPGAYLIVWADEDESDEPGLHASFKLSRGGERVLLVDADEWGNAILDSVIFGEQETDIAFGRSPDGNGRFEKLFFPTPMGMNRAATAVLEETDGAQPQRLVLGQNYPNPFNSGTTVRFSIPEGPARVDLEIYSLTGQKILSLVRGELSPGEYAMHWDGRDQSGRELASGAYLYRLRAGTQVETRRMLLLR